MRSPAASRRKFADDAPRVVPTDDGGEAWVWQDQLLPNVGFNAVAGRPSNEYGFEPTRFDEMRRGAWDVDARVADMDIDGVCASLCFPSFLPGFVGQRLTLWPDDDELALAAMRAYNDWHLEAWAGAHPGRFIPNQITYLRDPELAADGDPPQRGTRLQGGDVLRSTRQARPAVDPLGLLGSVVRRVRGDRDRAVPARRLLGHVADDLRRRAARDPGGAVRRVRHVLARSTGSTRRSRCASPTSRSACRKAASVGSRGSWTGSTTATGTNSATCRRGATSPSRRARCCAATSGSARSTTTPGCSYATASASTTSSSSPTTRTPTRRGRTRKRCSCANSKARASATTTPPHHLAERVGAVPSPGAGRAAALTVSVFADS